MDSRIVPSILTLIATPFTIWTWVHALGFAPHASTVSRAQIAFAVISCWLATTVQLSVFKRLNFAISEHARKCGRPARYPHKDPILGLDLFFSTVAALKKDRLHQTYLERFEKFGHTYSALLQGAEMIMTDEPENVKAILSTSFDDWPIAGPRLLAALPVLGPNSVFSSNGAKWQTARHMIRPSFVRDQVADLACFDRHVGHLIKTIPKDGSTFDVQKMIMDMTMDSATDFLLGHSSNTLLVPSPEADQFVRDFEYVGHEAASKAHLGRLMQLLPRPRLEAAVKRMRAYVHFYLDKAVERKGTVSKERSYVFLDELLKEGMPDEYVVDQILSILIAGRDTTAAVLTMSLWFLARHPDMVVKLRQEIEELGVETPTWIQLRDMKYLNAVLKEAMRLFPPVASNAREANKDTVLPRGGGPDGKEPILVAKGTPVRWSTFSMHRRKDIFGPDADEFRPERWLDPNFRVTWEYIPFSGGPRICIGQQFALTQLSFALFRIFQNFKAIEARDSDAMRIRTSLTIALLDGCKVSMTPA